MSDLIKISYEAENPTVSARELHEALEVETRYNDWFKRMAEYGFEENKDFYSILSKTSETGGRPSTDHEITIPMAKELCMLQRTPKGKEFRQYFIAVEEQWNSPESVMSRALQFANRQLDGLRNQNLLLTTENQVQKQQIAELQPKASYYDVVLNCKDLLSMAFPRLPYQYGKVEEIAPLRVKQAQVELALWLSDDTKQANQSQRQELQSQGVESFSIGDLSESYGKGVGEKPAPLLCSKVKALVAPYLDGGYDIC